jgi:hypothetical protein
MGWRDGKSGGVSRTSGRIDRLDYAWVPERDGFGLVGSSLAEPENRSRWDIWLSGLQEIRQGAGVRQPESTRSYLTDGTFAAVVNRELSTGGSGRRDISVGVLVGAAADLSPSLALRLHPWPPAGHPADRPAGPDRLGVAPLDIPTLPPPPPDAEDALLATLAAATAPEIPVTSPVERLGPVRLVEPLAALTAGALEQLRRQAAGEQRHQLVLVGADEPTARSLLLALTEVLAAQLGALAPAAGWPTFSTFEAAHPVPTRPRWTRTWCSCPASNSPPAATTAPPPTSSSPPACARPASPASSSPPPPPPATPRRSGPPGCSSTPTATPA